MENVELKEFIKKVQAHLGEIRQTRKYVLDSRRLAKEQYEERLLQIERRQIENQKRCPHVTTTYYPDASGNNDSHYECEDCGYCAKRL